MADAARVTSLDALRELKVALQVFAEETTVALSEATSDAQRGLWFVATDCKAHWARELKKRSEKLQQAKAELFKKQLESNDTRTSAVVERKNVAKWEAAVAQAEQKLVRIKHWASALEREFILFRAGVQGMSNIVASDIPTATARIDRMIKSLEEYIRLAAPMDASARSSSDAGETASEAAAASTLSEMDSSSPPLSEESSTP